MKYISIYIFFLFTFVFGFGLPVQAKPGREFVASDIYKCMQSGDKLALLMVHFGSAYPEARIRVLDVINPTDALRKLKEEGYTHVIIQSTSIIEGVEMEALRNEAENMKHLFKDLRVGNPLLYDDSDYKSVIKAICNQETKKTDDIRLLAAHGTYHASNSAYAMLGYMFQIEGHPNYLTGTIEGFPTISTVISK